jgi:hypothetical protein
LKPVISSGNLERFFEKDNDDEMESSEDTLADSVAMMEMEPSTTLGTVDFEVGLCDMVD